MPTIRKRGKAWHVQVRRAGYPPLTKSFTTKTDALAWSREKERSIDRAELPPNIGDLKRLTIGNLLTRYRHEITPRKRGAVTERSRLGILLSHRISQTSLNNLSGGIIAQYRDDRLRKVKPASARRELTILRHVFEVARRDWDIPIRENPFVRVRMPPDSPARERRLVGDEEAKLFAAIGPRAAWYLRPFLILLIETGMRRGELLSIRWQDIDFTRRTVQILKTKNGYSRRIPLTPTALETLKAILRDSNQERVFPINAGAVRLAWVRLCRKAGLIDLRMHDLRHEAVSRFFEYGLSIPEVTLISGHRDPRMLNRYTHLKPELVAAKLEKAIQEKTIWNDCHRAELITD